MRFCLPGLLVLLICLNGFSWQTGSAVAQPPSNAATNNSSSTDDSPQITERELETYYLEQEDGTLKPFINLPFEELDELYKLYKGLQQPDQPPRFLLRDLNIAGDVQGEVAYFTVSATAAVQADGWVRIPLKLNQAMLVSDTSQNSDPNSLLEFTQDTGFVWRVKGKAGQQHSLNVRVCTKLRTLGAQTLLELAIPKATTSRLQLVVPESGIEATANENAFRFDHETVQGNKTRVTVEGIGGQLRLAWRERQSAPPASAIFGVTGDVRMGFEDQRLHTDATLRLSVTSGEVKSVIVQLPPKMQHQVVDQPGVAVKLLPSSDPRLKQARADCEHLELTLQHPSTDAVDFRVAGQRTLEPAEIGQPIDVAGFNVLGAVSQTGTISLAADSDWAFQWSHDSTVEQVEENSSLSSRQSAAKFIYSSQPYSFRVKVSRKELLVHAEPRFELTIEPARVLLVGAVSYRLRGTAARTISLDLSGWELTDLTVNDRNVFADQLPETSRPIQIPIGELDQSQSHDFDLSFSAEMFLQPGGELAALLPKLYATSYAPAQLVVHRADNVEVLPSAEKSAGLAQVAETLSGDPATQTTHSVVYRGWTKPDRLVYAAQVRLRPPEVVVTTSGKVSLGHEAIALRQDITYRVLYQPVPRLLLKLPAAVEDDGFQISLDGDQAKWTVVSKENGASVVAIELIEPQPATYQLTVAYHAAVGQVQESESERFTVPLAVPIFDGEGHVSETTVTVEDPAGRILETDDVWTIVSTETVEGVPTMQLRASAAAVDTLHLNVSGLPLRSSQDSVVEVAWLQTWISDSLRSDRLTVRLSTRRDQVRFRLPMSAEVEDVAIDRQKATQQVTLEAGDVVVKLPTKPGDEPTVVEIWYSIPEEDLGPGRYVLDLPQPIDVDWTRRFYWQLVLPSDEHLVLAANGLNSESEWKWNALPIGRTARFDQRALEQLVGSSEQLPLPESTNQYLFSTQGSVARVQFTTADRSQILLLAAATAFIAGLLLIYVPHLRHPATLLTLCVVLGVIGLLFPQPTLQLLQLSTIGMLFVLLAFAIKWVLARSRTGPAVVHGTSLGGGESTATHAAIASIESSSYQSTQMVLPQASDSISK